MSVDTARAHFERRQRDVFRDKAVIERPASAGTLSSTGDWTPGAATGLYDGPCLLRAFVWEGTDVVVGGEEVRLSRVRAKFPRDTTVAHDDIVRPTASTYDSSMVGKSYRVTDVFEDGWQICRTVIAEEIT